MSYKQIETSREIRLWIGQIIVPAITTGALIYAGNPNVRNFVDEKVENVKNKFKYRKVKIVK